MPSVKTQVGDCRVPGLGFEFLGYRFEDGRRDVRKKSLDKLKGIIRERTRRTRGDSLEVVIANLNRVLRGWFGYFRLARSRIFFDFDELIRRRLRALLRKQEKRSAVGRDLNDQLRWPNAYFADAGLFALHTANRETVSKKKPPTGEPDAEKPPVRFGGGCALQVRPSQPPEMAAAAKPSEQPRTKSCVTAAAKRRPGGCRPERK